MLRKSDYSLTLTILAIVIWAICSWRLAAQERQPLVCIINYPFQIWNQANTKIHVCVFKPDFSPAVGAKIEVDGVGVGITDQHGTCIFTYAPGNGPHKLMAQWRENGVAYEAQQPFKCNARTAQYHADRLYVYTDRGIYNPGQTIHLRCIAWEFAGNYRPLRDAKIKIVLQDMQSNIYSGGYLHTNDYGVGAFQIPLPPNMQEGSYNLVVFYQETKESAVVKIERFVPPLIRIEHNLPHYLTASQESLPIEVKLSFFAGGIVRKSVLDLAAFRWGQEVLHYQPPAERPDYYRFVLNKQQLDEIRASLSQEQTFQIRLTAKDQYGRTDTVTRDIVYSTRPYNATLESVRKDYREQETVQIVAKVVEKDQQPARNIALELQVGSDKLRQTTDDHGTARFTFVMGTAPLTVQLYSPLVNTALTSLYIPLAKTPRPVASHVTAAAENVETPVLASFDPNYIPVEKVMHLDLTDISGSLVLATTLPITQENDRYVARGKITAPTWGTMLVTLYCCAIQKHERLTPGTSNVGVVTEGQQVTFQPAQKLAIVFPDLKPRARPGEKFPATVRVDNLDNEEACLGVAVVDEAVISLADPMEKKPGDYFYNPQLKTIATDGSAVLTWPVLDRNWGSPWSDIAYQNWGWKAPGTIRGKRSKKPADMPPLKLEIVFVLDTTSSMGGMIEEAKAKIWSIVNTITANKPTPEIKVGLVAYRDKGDVYVTKVIDMSKDLNAIYSQLIAFQADGGGDTPEDVNLALANAVDKIVWSSGQDVVKLIYLVGDAPPQMEYGEETYHTSCPRALQKQIIINTIRCGSNDGETVKHWQQIAALAGGKYTAVTNAQAVASELDRQISQLNEKLDDTFVAYGPDLESKKQQMIAKERELLTQMQRTMSTATYDQAQAERVIYKINKLDELFAQAGDLVQQYRDNPELPAKLPENELPQELRTLTPEKRPAYLDNKLLEREEIKNKILELERRRRGELQAKLGDSLENESFEVFVVETLKQAARKHGIEIGQE